ncbi:MAG: hypothetical protein LBO69_05995 [Ignavibacteria bacterium]|jgi:hypothetical protein|nr:hypothetical protein [Ignavibacteria bacterium]
MGFLKNLFKSKTPDLSNIPDLEEKKALRENIYRIHQQIVVTRKQSKTLKDTLAPLGPGFAGYGTGIFDYDWDIHEIDYWNLKDDEELLKLDLRILQLAADTILKIKEEAEQGDESVNSKRIGKTIY